MDKLTPENYMEGHSIDQLGINTHSLLISFSDVPWNTGLVETVLDFLEDHKVSVDILTQTAPVGGKTENAFIIESKNYDTAEELLDFIKERYPEVKGNINDHIARISISGIGMRTRSGVAAQFLNVFSKLDISVFMITTSEIRIAAVIDLDDLVAATEALKKKFDL